MATETTAAQPPGALQAVSGWFSNLITTAMPVAQTYLNYRTQKEAAKNSPASYTPQSGSAGEDWRGTVTPTGAAAITSAPWFPFAIGGGVLLVLGFLFFALKGRK